MSRTIDVRFERDEFSSGIDGENRTFTLSFSYSPSPAIVHWNDILDRPNQDNPKPFHRVAFTGEYDLLEGKPTINGVDVSGDKMPGDYGLVTPEDIPEVEALTNNEIDNLLSLDKT